MRGCAVEQRSPRSSDPSDPITPPGPSSRRMTGQPSSHICVICTDPSVSNSISLIGSPAKNIVCRALNIVVQAVDTTFAQSDKGISANSGDSSADRQTGREPRSTSMLSCRNCKRVVGETARSASIVHHLISVSGQMHVLFLQISRVLVLLRVRLLLSEPYVLVRNVAVELMASLVPIVAYHKLLILRD